MSTTTTTTITPYNRRLASYTHWPHTHPSAPDMAGAGFHSTPNKRHPDSTTCPSCNLKMHDWKQHETPFGEHMRRKPNCPYVLGGTMSRNSTRAVEETGGFQTTGASIVGEGSEQGAGGRTVPRVKLPKGVGGGLPMSQLQAFDEWVSGAKREFLELFEEAQIGSGNFCLDVSMVDAGDRFSVLWGDDDVLLRILAYLYIRHGAIKLHQGNRDMSGTTWISFTRPSDTGTVMALVSVPRKGSVNQSANTTTVLPSGNENIGPNEAGKESKHPTKLENVQEEAIESRAVDCVPADDDWERVDDSGEEWMTVGMVEFS